ncbi:glycerophosphodiester phosphodiesterase [Pedobacter chinensis]|uniref:Glycerophosphodiester phosphodiesterase n=2 Tax=Pedobacter chinensis TaxID=2282421 RepID=A0A369Q3E3_9SPHI|nr:glycerophosphodiester phosphodiesterase [Pedobacter chinensis]
MKAYKIVFLFVLCFGISPALGQKSADVLIKQLHQPHLKSIMVASHRGDWRNAPENSLQAFSSAMAMGVDIIELDLKLSKDNVLIILHDQTLNRSTTGKGKPSDFTLTELKEFRLRDGLGAPTRQQIPTLEEVMLLAKGKVLVNLDHSFPFYNEAYKVLIKTGTLEQALFKTEKPYAELKNRYPELLDKITFMPVVLLDKPDARQIILEYQKYMMPVACELVFKSDTSSVIKDGRFVVSGGSKLWVNSLWPNISGGHDDELAIQGNTKDSWDWLIDCGVTMIQTDRPKELIEYLRKRKLHN